MICCNPVHFPSISAPVKGIRIFQTLDWSIWGRADLVAFEGRPAPAAHYDGRAKSGWFGIDGRSEQWVAGAALSKTWSETDYRLDASSGQQRMRTELTALYPYGRWALDEQSAVHAIAGIGSGEVRNMRAMVRFRRKAICRCGCCQSALSGSWRRGQTGWNCRYVPRPVRCG